MTLTWYLKTQATVEVMLDQSHCPGRNLFSTVLNTALPVACKGARLVFLRHYTKEVRQASHPRHLLKEVKQVLFQKHVWKEVKQVLLQSLLLKGARQALFQKLVWKEAKQVLLKRHHQREVRLVLNQRQFQRRVNKLLYQRHIQKQLLQVLWMLSHRHYQVKLHLQRRKVIPKRLLQSILK